MFEELIICGPQVADKHDTFFLFWMGRIFLLCGSDTTTVWTLTCRRICRMIELWNKYQ